MNLRVLRLHEKMVSEILVQDQADIVNKSVLNKSSSSNSSILSSETSARSHGSDPTPNQRTLRLASYAANNSTSFGVL